MQPPIPSAVVLTMEYPEFVTVAHILVLVLEPIQTTFSVAVVVVIEALDHDVAAEEMLLLV